MSVDESQAKMTLSDYPSLYAVSDRAAAKAQDGYLTMQMYYLASLGIAGVVGAVGPRVSQSHVWTGTAATLFLAVGVVLLWIMRGRRLDKTWFDGRAIAESVKTSAWRYMMGVAPYGLDRDSEDADRELLSQLDEIHSARPGIEKTLASDKHARGPQITELMRQVRRSPFESRVAFYRRERLQNQEAWYKGKAAAYARSATAWFWIVATLQTVALPLAIINLTLSTSLVEVAPVAASLVGPLVAWVQIRRYDELAQTYALAAQELGKLESMALRATTEEQFRQLVMQAEEASSREHTMWCARRETSLARLLG
jgi:hypothetical protein